MHLNRQSKCSTRFVCKSLLNHFQRYSLAHKGSYRAKFMANATNEELPKTNNRPFVKISPTTLSIFEEGKLLLIDKTAHWSSFDVVKSVRSYLKVRRVGHAGTLDPLATGLLIVCTGKFTKKINDFMAQSKEYTGTFTLGATTPTYDLESLPENQTEVSHITEAEIHKATEAFVGEIDQVPPIYSAIKKAGTPMYTLARRGEDIDLQPRKINIESFEITGIQLPVVSFKIRCSTGTYIRSLANDFGKQLGCGAFLSSLRRTAIGDFRVEDAFQMDNFLDMIVEMQSKEEPLM